MAYVGMWQALVMKEALTFYSFFFPFTISNVYKKKGEPKHK